MLAYTYIENGKFALVEKPKPSLDRVIKEAITNGKQQ